MPPFCRKASYGRERGRRLSLELGQEIRAARHSAGLSQRAVAAAVGISQGQQSKIERGVAAPTILMLTSTAAVVGLDLSIRAFPGGSPLRDAGHVRVLARLQGLLPGSYQWRTELPLPMPGDRRAIDAMVTSPRITAGFELETRLGDGQNTARRTLLKQRDAGLAAMILVLPDTRHNRAAVVAGQATLRASFPLDSRQVLLALRAGATPPANGILFV